MRHQPRPLPEPARCWCPRDADGRCATCREKIRACLAELLELVKSYVERSAAIGTRVQELCEPCINRDADAAVAGLVEPVLAPLPDLELRAGACALLVQLLDESGIPHPISDAAFARLAQPPAGP